MAVMLLQHMRQFVRQQGPPDRRAGMVFAGRKMQVRTAGKSACSGDRRAAVDVNPYERQVRLEKALEGVSHAVRKSKRAGRSPDV